MKTHSIGGEGLSREVQLGIVLLKAWVPFSKHCPDRAFITVHCTPERQQNVLNIQRNFRHYLCYNLFFFVVSGPLTPLASHYFDCT